MTETFPNLSVIEYHDDYGFDKFEIRGFNPEKSSSISFEKVDPKYGEVIGVLNEKELDMVLGEYSYKNVESKTNEVAAIKQAYQKAKENNFLNAALYEVNGINYTALSMQKDGHFYRGVLGGAYDSFLVDGRPMNDKEKFDLFYKAQCVLGDKGMQKFGLVEQRNGVIDGARRTAVPANGGTVMDNALNPMHYLGAECAIRVRED